MALVAVEGDREQGVQGVHPDAALEAGAGELTEPALHPVLRHHVLHRFGDVQEPVDRSAGDGREGGRQLRLVGGELVGGGHRIDRGPDEWMIERLVDQLAEEVDPQVAPAQASEVVLCALDSVPRLPRHRCLRSMGCIVNLPLARAAGIPVAS